MLVIETVKKILPSAGNISKLSTGGQKVVFKAVDRNYGNIVVKLMLPTASTERLKREINIVSSNKFPNVPQIYDFGEFDTDSSKVFFIIEQFIEGNELRTIIQKKGLDFLQVMNLLSDLLNTVAALENCGIIHRDIKPENIIRCISGNFWLLDFGIARDLKQSSLTATADHFGPHTAGYAAPEQFRNMKKKIDSRADLFSIGVVVYESLTGTHPFACGARDYLDILKRTESLTITPLLIKKNNGRELSLFIHSLMEKYPSRRPPTAEIAKNWFSEIKNKMK